MNARSARISRAFARTRPAVAAAVVIAVAFSGSGVAPVEASPMRKTQQLRESILAEVREAAAVHRAAAAADEPTAEPIAQAVLDPGRETTLEASKPEIATTFSGYDIAEPLELSMRELGQREAASAETETAGVAVMTPVEITATSDAGVEVTQFPAEVTNTRGDGPKLADGPVVSDVTAGVELEVAVDEAAVKAAKLDPTTLRLYSREGDGDPWTEVPSYFDADAGVVRASSNHLSQFVVIGVPFPAPPGPRIVLDPDNDEGHTTSPATTSEFGFNWALATQLKAMLETQCLAEVVLTRPTADPMVPRATRAGVAASANPVATLGIGFNTWQGHGWGTESSGGTDIYSRGGALDQALTGQLIATMPAYTGRPAEQKPATGSFPLPEFGGLPGAYTHMETLFLDHNYDWPVIRDGFPHIVNGVFTGLGQYLQSQGFDCTDPVTGGWPSPPSQAELARWKHLGDQNYQTYGADPVSFSTGNLFEDEPIFSLTGPGGQVTDLTLFYNAQDGRLSRVGAGWSFGLGARAQRFDDGSVLTVRGDGASYVFTPDGTGGYTDADDTGMRLIEAGGGTLELSKPSGESWRFDAADVDGIGELIRHTTADGLTTTLTYGAGSWRTHQFLPLASITDSGGQTIAVESDAVGRVTAFRHPDGRAWTLGYDPASNLVSITDPAGGIRSFGYDDKHRMLTATDAEGITYLKNQYDSADRVVKQWDADGNLRTFDYSEPGVTVYTDNEGRESRYGYDEGFRITSITDATGGVAKYRYGDRNQVETFTDEAGHVTRYSYDDDGNVTQEHRPDGSVVRHTYTPTGLVASTTDLDGERTTSYGYDGAGRLVLVTRPDDTELHYGYDAAGDLATSTEASGAVTSFAYDGRGNLTRMTDPAGAVWQYRYDAANRLIEQVSPGGGSTRYEWDALDRLATAIDPEGGATTFRYDRNDHLVEQVDPVGAITRYSWDALFRLASVTAPDGGVTTYRYNTEDALTAVTDPLGAVTAFELDQLDRPVVTVDPNGGEWARSFDPTGELLTSTDPAGAVTTNLLDDAGRTVKTSGPTGITTRVEYDDAGRVVSTADAEGNAIGFEYDSLDRVTKQIDQAGFETEYLYDIDGRLVGTIDRQGNPTAYRYDAASRVAEVVDATGATTTFAYDADGNLTSVTDPTGVATTSAYDRAGRLVSSMDAAGNAASYAYDPAGQLIGLTDPTGAITTYAYAATGQLAKLTDPLGAVTAYRYDLAGQHTGTTDANGVDTAYRYDPAGQLTEVIEALDAAADPVTDVNVTTGYEYSAAGDLTRIIDANGQATSFEYDEASQLIAETDPLGNATRHRYDALGRIAATTNANGDTVSYRYDRRGDLTAQSWPGTSHVFEYDPEQRLIAAVSPSGATGFRYDDVGRTTLEIAETGERTSYRYDPAGRLTELGLPTGQQVGYSYDDAGRADTQTTPWGDLGYQWTPAGQLAKITRATGTTTDYSYDPAGQVTSILHSTPMPDEPAPIPEPPAEVLSYEADQCALATGYLENRTLPDVENRTNDCVKTWDYVASRTLPEPARPTASSTLRFDYTYDPVGHVTSQVRTLAEPDPAEGTESPFAGTTTLEHAYDRIGRLTETTSSGGVTDAYSYDPAGNRTGHTRAGDVEFEQVAAYDAAGQVRQSATSGDVDGSASYEYDRAGNRTRQVVDGSATSYRYDATSRLTSADTDGRSLDFGYDALGRRTATSDTSEHGTLNSTQHWSVMAPSGVSTSGQNAVALVRDVTGELAIQASAGDVSWELLDRLASTVASTDETGQLTQLAAYSDRGMPRFDTTGWDARLNFTGEPDDPTAGITAFYARNYDTTTGTLTTRDLWRGLQKSPQTLNRYAYVLNDPASLTDWMGYLPLGGGDKADPVNTKERRDIAIASKLPFGKYTGPPIKKGSGSNPRDKSSTSAVHSKAGEWWEPWKWNENQWQDFGAGALGVTIALVGGAALLACVAATAGICAAAGAGFLLAGGVTLGAGASVATYHYSSGSKTAAGYAESAAWGGVTGGLFSAAGPFVGAVTRPAIPINGGGAVAKAPGLSAFELTQTKTVANHAHDLTRTGALARPYNNSNLTVQEIMNAAKPIPDPGGLPGGLRWDVPGSLNGSQGTWQLVVNPTTNEVVHYMFKSGG